MANFRPKLSDPDQANFNWAYLIAAGLALALILALTVTACSAILCWAGAVWLHHNQHHFLGLKSENLVSSIASASGLFSSTFAGLSLLAVVYTLQRQDKQRQDDMLRNSLIDILERLDHAMPKDLLDKSVEHISDTLSVVQREANLVTTYSKDNPVDPSKFWDRIAKVTGEQWSWQQLRKQRAMLVALLELSRKASPDQQRFLRSIRPAYLPLDYMKAVLCDAFAGKDLLAIRAVEGLGLLDNCLHEYGELSSDVKYFLK